MGASMSFTITKTSYGPVLTLDDNTFTIMDGQDMIQAYEEVPDLLAIIEDHLMVILREAFDETLQALEAGIQMNSSLVYGYLNAYNQFNGFKNGFLPNYLRQLADVERHN
jgi:hypothetical protein